MTIEQLKKGNEIHEKINTFKNFLTTQNKHESSYWYLQFWGSDPDVIKYDLNKFPGIKDVVRDYTVKKIAELEKQLEEL